MRRPLIEAKDFKLSLDKGTKLKEGHGGLPRERVLCVCGKERKRRRKFEEECLVLMCGEVFMEKKCARIKHGRKLCVTNTCSKAFGILVQLIIPLKSIVGFVSKLKKILVCKVKKLLPKFQHHRSCCQGATLVGSRGCCGGVHERNSMTKPLDFYFN
jgi:hypothetical protein